MAGLYGEYRHKLDAKGRLSLPASIRKNFTEETQLVIVPDTKGDFLSVYTVDAFEAWVESVFEKRGGYDPNNRDHMMLRSMLNASATPTAMDGVGRISVAAKLREKVGVEKEVVLVGNTDRFDIWDSQRWDAAQQSINLDALLYG